MKCEACGTETHGASHNNSETLRVVHEDGCLVHTLERCRDALKAQLDEARTARDAYDGMRQLADDLRRDAVLRCESAIAMHQAAGKRAVEAERERDVFKTCIGKLDELGNEEDAVLGAVIAQRDTANARAERFRTELMTAAKCLRLAGYSADAERTERAALAADPAPEARSNLSCNADPPYTGMSGCILSPNHDGDHRNHQCVWAKAVAAKTEKEGP